MHLCSVGRERILAASGGSTAVVYVRAWQDGKMGTSSVCAQEKGKFWEK